MSDSKPMPNKLKIVNHLYKNNDRDFTLNELGDALKDDMSSDALKLYHRQLVQDGILFASPKKRYCSITARMGKVYTMKKPPLSMRLLMEARGLLREEDKSK